MIYDITRTISHQIAVWPGDAVFNAKQVSSIDEGQSVNLTTLTISPHTGTHADARWHYEPDGVTIAGMPLEPYIGTCHVVTITKQNGGITPGDFDGVDLDGMERLLIHTWCSDIPDHQWPEDFPYPTAELIDWLAGRGCVLLGVDMPSMDEFTSTDLPGHHALTRNNIANLELVSLKDVPDGTYELIALPLKIKGACGSPVRAVLRS